MGKKTLPEHRVFRRPKSRPKSRQKWRRGKEGYEHLIRQTHNRKRSNVSWNARRFDPTSPNLRRHLRHKSKVHEQFFGGRERLSPGELEGLRDLARDAHLHTIFFTCLEAERAVVLDKNMDIIRKERDDSLQEVSKYQALVRELRGKIRGLEHTIERIRKNHRGFGPRRGG